MTVLSVADAAAHVGATVSAVNQAIYAGHLTARVTDRSSTKSRRQVKGVEQEELEEWARHSPHLRGRHIVYDYTFFVEWHGMTDEQACARVAAGYEAVTPKMVRDTVNYADKKANHQ